MLLKIEAPKAPHTFASWAMMRGASLKELQELLGHASLTMTMRHAHLSPERRRTAVSRLDGLTSGAVPAEVTSDRAQGRAQEPSKLPLVSSVRVVAALLDSVSLSSTRLFVASVEGRDPA